MPNLYEYKINSLLIKRYDPNDFQNGIPGYPISTNGSFYFCDPGMRSAGPANVGGKIESGDTSDARNFTRGGVGIVNGQVLVRRIVNTNRNEAGDIAFTFGGTPSTYMGGGFMLIENSRIIPIGEIISQQNYDVKGEQLKAANHILIGNFNGAAYLVVALKLHYSNIVNRLRAYSHLCMLDGGRACWVRTPQLNITGRGENKVDPPYFALGVKGQLAKSS